MATLIVLLAAGPAQAEAKPAEWQVRASIPHPVYGHSSAAIGGRVHVLGGCDTPDWQVPSALHQVYDVLSDTWTTAADLPLAVGWAMPALHEGRIYLFGGGCHEEGVGLTATDKAWVYDPASDQWSEIRPLPEPRMNGCAVSIGDFIYIAMGYHRRGGRDEDVREEYVTTYRYDPESDTYARVSDSPHTGCYIAAGEYGGRLYAVVGTYHEATAMQDRVPAEGALEYDPREDVWTYIDVPRVLRRVFYATQCSASVMHDGRLHVVGGVSERGRTGVTSHFDVRARRFVRGPDLPEGRCCGGGVVSDGVLIIAGGFLGDVGDPGAPTWALTLYLEAGR